MKQVFCFLLIFALICITFTAVAEDDTFSFRNGVHFGDNIEDIVSKEGTEGYRHTDSRGMDVLTYSEITLSSISGSVLEYYFKDDHLDFFFLVYGVQRLTLLNSSFHTSNYRAIEDGLISKYGEMNPEFSLDNIQTYYGCALNSVKTNEPENIIEWSHRELAAENGKTIVIEHLLLGRPFYGEVQYGHYLTYKIVESSDKPNNQIISDL